MTIIKIDALCPRAIRLMAAAGFLCLAGCGGGGGGGGSFSGVTTATSPATTPTALGATVGAINLVTLPNTPLLATAATPSFKSGVTDGTAFPLTQSVLSYNSTSVSDFNGGQSSLTLVGVKTSSGIVATGTGAPVFLLTVSGLGLGSDAQLPVDGTPITLASGATMAMTGTDLTYTLLGNWSYQTAARSAYFGTLVAGFQTPDGNVPKTGGVTYGVGDGVSQGPVIGTVYIPDGTGSVTSATLSGVIRIGVNFATGIVGGNATGMTATPPGGGIAQGWDILTLNATISGATFNGTTSVSAVGTGNFSLSTGATGKFTGAFYGPNADEMGAIWVLNDPGANKSAVGAIAATKLNLP